MNDVNFRDIILGDWQLFLDFIWNMVYSIWPIVVIFVAVAAFGFILEIVTGALSGMFKRG